MPRHRKAMRDDEGLVPDHIEAAAKRFGGWTLVAIGGIAALFLGLGACQAYYDRTTTKVTVTSKENICDSSGSGESSRVTCDLMIFGDNGKSYKVANALFGTFRMNAREVYGRIQVGQTYCITSYGFDAAWANMYENIERYEPVDPVTKECP